MVKLFRTHIGEEIIGKVISSIENKSPAVINIKNPCILVNVPVANSQPKLSMQPILTYLDNDVVEFKADSFMAEGIPVVEIRNQWESVFGSGIITKESEIITKQPGLHKL